MDYCNVHEEKLIRILKARRGIPVSAPELAAMLRLGGRQTRAMISHLTEDHELAICATPASSYSWPQEPEDCDHTEKSLDARIDALRRRKAGFLAGKEKEFGGRERLFGLEAVG